MHPSSWDTGEDFPDEYVQLIKTWMEFLSQNGYSFEVQDTLGRTPLLAYSSLPGGRCLAIVRLLLEFGANMHAVDSNGCNAIQLAMYSNTQWRQYEVPKVLEEKLSLFIEAGVDLNHRDQWGATPSHDARCHFQCWAVWCRALERNGRKVDEVVREDGELWLLEESREEESDEKESDEKEINEGGNEEYITLADSSES